MKSWTRYYDAVGDEPRDTLLDALGRFAEAGVAVDLGFGTGRDTFELLRRGWRVTAIDSEPEALRRLLADVAAGDRPALETQVARFEDAVLPPCDLVNASWSLPFCAPARFGEVWARIEDALRPGGRFCGQLFGDRDGWAPADDITFLTRGEAERLFDAFEVERFDEEEEDSQTAVGDPKHWHVYHVVTRKP
jgi:SAM-dependent methyltransferase